MKTGSEAEKMFLEFEAQTLRGPRHLRGGRLKRLLWSPSHLSLSCFNQEPAHEEATNPMRFPSRRLSPLRLRFKNSARVAGPHSIQGAERPASPRDPLSTPIISAA
jgi:hypothetical protein